MGNNKGKDGAVTSAISCSLNAATAAQSQGTLLCKHCHHHTQFHIEGPAQHHKFLGTVRAQFGSRALKQETIPWSWNGAVGAEICYKTENGNFMPRIGWASRGDDQLSLHEIRKKRPEGAI
eukprot:1149232-Pelagomonas_calceolata.AAC.3